MALPQDPTATKKHAAPDPWNALVNRVLGMGTPDYSALAKTANAQAAAQTASAVNAIRGQQAIDEQQAAARARQLGQAALGTAQYLGGLNLPGLTAQDYARSAAAERGAAAGYSSGLQQTVGDAAAKVQANLNAIGSPQTALNQGAAAGDVLYGLGGNIPAQGLDVVGPTVAAGLRALPAQTLGYGQTLAAGALGAGREQAARLEPQIVAAQARQATLAADYLSKLETAARQSGQNQIANTLSLLRLKQSEDAAKALADYRDAVLSKPTIRGSVSTGLAVYDPKTGKLTTTPGQPTWAQQAAATGLIPGTKIPTQAARDAQARADQAQARLDQETARIKEQVAHNKITEQQGQDRIRIATENYNRSIAPTFSASNSRTTGYATDQYGNPIPSTDGKISVLPGFKINSAGKVVKVATSSRVKKPGGLTQSQWQSAYGDLNGKIDDWYHGVPELTDARGQVTRSKQDPLTYQQAFAQARLLYPTMPPKKIVQMLNLYYRIGEGGRPIPKGYTRHAIAPATDILGLNPAGG